MPKLKIMVRFWLAITILMIAVLVPLEFLLHELLNDFYSKQVQEPLLYHSQQLATLLAEDPSAIQVAPMMGHMVGGEVLVLDPTGNPLRFEGSSEVPPPSLAAGEVLTGHTYVGQVTLSDERQVIITAVPIPGGRGAVLLLAPAEPVQRSLKVARRYLWIAGGLTLALGAGLAWVLARGLVRPVIAIERATRSIARGDFSTRVEVDEAGTDELSHLADAVNSMTAQLEAFENRRREFLANVAHELRTPLSYIRGYTQAIAEGLVSSPEERERYQRIVQEEADRVGQLVGDLMDLAQMEEGQLAFDMQPVDLSLPVGQAAGTITPHANAKGVRVDVPLPHWLPQVRADGGRIQQVVFNLLDNGLRYTPAGGTLRVSAEAAGGWVTVRVADTGPGIEPDMLPLVFERFHKRHSSGRGLGLAIVRSIVRAHGGEVGAENRPEGGAVFWFKLPVSGAHR